MAQCEKSVSATAGPRRQRGQAFLVTALLALIGAAAAIYGFSLFNRAALEADQTTAAALAQAKEALIGYAATHATRPGSLPCPDTVDSGQQLATCAGTLIGRLPWKTLGLPDLRDGAGQRLWYAVSNNFKNSPASGILNSDTPGDYTVNGAAGAIAVVFAPGAAIGAQLRDAANNNNIASYLDGGNEAGGPAFNSGGAGNDRLLAITRETLFPPVEKRVVREIGNTLQLYYTDATGTPPTSNNRYYPYPAPFSGSTVCDSTTPLYRGRIPLSCPLLAGLTLPTWFSTNRWNEVVVYAVAPRCTPRITTTTTPDLSSPQFAFAPIGGMSCVSYFGGLFYICYPFVTTTALDPNPALLNCNNTGGYLTVTGVSNVVEALLFSAGPGLANPPQTRPCTTAANCLEDTPNTDVDDQIYVRPQKSATNNDNLLIVRPPGL